MSLATPPKIRTLQRKLYIKAKEDPRFRFYSLYDKVCRGDILAYAYSLAKSNGGSPGVDGETFRKIEEQGLEEWLTDLQERLNDGRYKPDAVRRVYIPKPGGGERPLGIPVIRDRVVPLSKYFDSIPHEDLLKSVARRISDGKVLHLIRLWLKAPIEETDGMGRVRRSGGRDHAMGTPQGGVISPLLANVYMNRFLRAWRERGMDRRLQATIVNYADDFVILCRGTAFQAMDVTRSWMTSLKLTLNEKKTCVRDANRECFDFLGYTFGPTVHRPTGRRYLAAQPSRKSVARLRERVRARPELGPRFLPLENGELLAQGQVFEGELDPRFQSGADQLDQKSEHGEISEWDRLDLG